MTADVMTKASARATIRECHQRMSETNSPFIRSTFAKLAMSVRSLLPLLD